MTERFELTGVVHLVRPEGERVGDLESLRAALERVGDRVLFHHTRSRLLQHPDAAELPPDDVSAWVAGVVQDRETAERLSYAAEARGESAPSLRAAWLEVLGSVPERVRASRTAPPGGEFVLLASESVPVPTGRAVSDPHELMEALAEADASVWFWHLVEEPWDARGVGPLAGWLERVGEPRLAAWFAEMSGSGRTLAEMRRMLVRRWRLSRLGGRVAAASGQSHGERTRAGREAVASLTRRLRRGPPS